MSKRVILFSQPSVSIFDKLKIDLFPSFLAKKTLGYLPSDGSNQEANLKYTPTWQQFAELNQAKFLFIDNSKRGDEAILEIQKLLSSDIVMISGGNTFTLLNHLRLSGLDKAILEFWQKDNVVLSGFSAGALVLTPTIEVCNTPNFDQNLVGITDLSGLNIVDFEVWPHYDPTQETELTKYKQQNHYPLKTISNEDILVIDQ